MNLSEYTALHDLIDDIDVRRDSDLLDLKLICRQVAASATLEYLKACEHKRIPPWEHMIWYYIDDDFSRSI